MQYLLKITAKKFRFLFCLKGLTLVIQGCSVQMATSTCCEHQLCIILLQKTSSIHQGRLDSIQNLNSMRPCLQNCVHGQCKNINSKKSLNDHLLTGKFTGYFSGPIHPNIASIKIRLQQRIFRNISVLCNRINA